MRNGPKVFIIILNWRGKQDTLECLESVYKMDCPNFDVIIVDNGSTDDSVTTIKTAFPQATLIENKKNLGFTGGNNIAMRYAMKNGGDYMWLLNNDTVVEPDTLSKLVDAAEKDADIGLVSPVIYYYDDPNKVQVRCSYIDWKRQKIFYPLDLETFDIWQENEPDRVCLWGTALLIRRDLIEKIGYLDERFFAYWEDVDFSVRSTRAGYRNVTEISAGIRHKNPIGEPGKIKRPPHFSYYIIRNGYFFWMKHLVGCKKFFYFWKYLANSMAQVASCCGNGATGYAEACFNGTWDAICGIDGPWRNKNIKLSRVFTRLLSWHPYFWVNLLRGNFLNIVSETLKRTKKEFVKRLAKISD